MGRGGYQGCHRDEQSYHWIKTSLCGFGSTQGRPQSSFGLAIHSTRFRHANATNGTDGIPSTSSRILPYRRHASTSKILRPKPSKEACAATTNTPRACVTLQAAPVNK